MRRASRSPLWSAVDRGHPYRDKLCIITAERLEARRRQPRARAMDRNERPDERPRKALTRTRATPQAGLERDRRARLQIAGLNRRAAPETSFERKVSMIAVIATVRAREGKEQDLKRALEEL